MILKVGRVTTLGLDDGLKRCGPSPPGRKHRPPDRGPADLDQFEAPLGKLPHLIRRSTALGVWARGNPTVLIASHSIT
jgi:hypothetical protein